jgi:hypothetical protein
MGMGMDGHHGMVITRRAGWDKAPISFLSQHISRTFMTFMRWGKRLAGDIYILYIHLDTVKERLAYTAASRRIEH